MPGRGIERRECGREIERKMEKQRGVEVFIIRESGESSKRARHARTGRAKPNEAGTCPEPERATLQPSPRL